MNLRHQILRQRLEYSLIAFFGVLLLSLLSIFAVDPSLYTTMLPSGLTVNERYPLPVILFLVALVALIGTVMYGIVHHWRWLFWLILVAFTGSVIQIPLDIAQITGLLANPYPVWYSLIRVVVGVIEMGFVAWMIQTYRHHGVWGTGKHL